MKTVGEGVVSTCEKNELLVVTRLKNMMMMMREEVTASKESREHWKKE